MLSTHMNLFKKKSKIKSANYDGIFKKLDIEGTAKQLSLAEKGTLAGQSEKPPSNSDSNDTNENRIISIIVEEKDQSYDEANKWFSAYRDRLKSLGIEAGIQTLKQGKQKFQTDIRAKLQNIQEGDLFKLIREIKRKSNNLKNFRDANLLSHEPSYKESKVLGVSIIFIIFLIESTMNGYFFAKGHQLGYLGGISQAVIISIINVGVNSILIGWVALRQIVHINWKRKTIGFISLLLFMTFVPIVNLMIAHYRQAYVMHTENPGITAINTFSASPLGLTDFDSYMLIIIGVAVCVITCIDIWVMFDPYPGYEKLHNNLNKLENEYTDRRIELVEDLQELRDESLAEIQNSLHELEYKQEEYRTIIEKMNRLKSQIEPHFSRLEQAARELLVIYRDANKESRKTPSPQRWEKEYNLDRPNLDSFSIPSAIDVSDVLARARKETPDIIKGINEEYDKTIDQIQTLESINSKNSNI